MEPVEVVYRYEDMTIGITRTNGKTNPVFHVRSRPAGKRIDHVTAVSVTDAKPEGDPNATLTAEQVAEIKRLAEDEVKRGVWKPLS